MYILRVNFLYMPNKNCHTYAYAHALNRYADAKIRCNNNLFLFLNEHLTVDAAVALIFGFNLSYVKNSVRCLQATDVEMISA